MSPRFDEVRRLADLEKKATPGPWFQENCIYQWDLYAVNHDLEPSPAHPWKLISADKNGYYPPESDAELIPSIRNAARWLTEVARCFQIGDAEMLDAMATWNEEEYSDVLSSHARDMLEFAACLRRMQKAAEIMEERE